MERRKDDQNEDNDEIAAALAAVYAFCGKDVEAAAQEPFPAISAWAAASRLESVARDKFVSAGQSPSKFFTWRNSFARKWTCLSIYLLLFSLIEANPAQALERIHFDPDSAINNQPSPSALSAKSSAFTAVLNRDKSKSENDTPKLLNHREPLCPIAPPIISAQDKLPARAQYFPLSEKRAVQPVPAPDYRSNLSNLAPAASLSKRYINIALNPNASTADIIVPDGAQIIDESSQHLLAELPAQSRWQLTIETGAAGKRLRVSGKIPNVGSAKLLIASAAGKYEPATYTRRFKATGRGGFSRLPQVVDSTNPKFFLPVKSAVPVLTAMKQDDFRPVAFQATPLPLTSIPESFVPPAVVSGYLIKPANPDGVISFDGKTYRGTIILKPKTSQTASFIVINLLDLEDYLLSVVPSEMPSGWSLEALKAQCIAARSYAIANLGKHQVEGYDLKASTDDQVYLGVQTESDATNRAVAETKGLVLKHKGKVVSAFFHSAGGGYTEQAENVWGGKLSYLKSVPDFDDQSPHFNWNRSIPVANIEDNLKKQGRDIGGLLGIFPLERSQSQRVTSAMLAGTLETILLSGEELRKILGLPSTVFNIGVGPDAYMVAGRGFGHGLGMSQWGAKYLSEQGYNASQILSYYYKDVTVDQF